MFEATADATDAAATGPRLLDALRQQIRTMHYSLRTEEAYVHWVRAFIHFHERRHPAELGRAEVEAFLTWLAAERGVAAATHRQALSALLFRYQRVLCQDLPWLAEIGRPRSDKRLPVVMSPAEVAQLLAQLDAAPPARGSPVGIYGLVARLLYGTPMRCGRPTVLRAWPVCSCPMRWRASTRARLRRGAGSGSSRRAARRSTRAAVSGADTIFWTAVSRSSSSARCRPAPWSSRPRRTRCTIRLPRICCRAGTTSARCKSCWGTPTSAPPRPAPRASPRHPCAPHACKRANLCRAVTSTSRLCRARLP